MTLVSVCNPSPLISNLKLYPHPPPCCSVSDTKYCLPPTGVNLPTVTRCQKQSFPVTAVRRVCASLCVRLSRQRGQKMNTGYVSRAYVAAVFVRTCLCADGELSRVLRGRQSRILAAESGLAGKLAPNFSPFSLLNQDNHSWHL